jgi:hypothetical protein
MSIVGHHLVLVLQVEFVIDPLVKDKVLLLAHISHL